MANEKVNEYLEKRKKKLEAEGKTTDVKTLHTTDGPAKGGSFGDPDKVNNYLKRRQERIEKSDYDKWLLERDRAVGKKVAERETTYIRGAEEERKWANRTSAQEFNRHIGGAEQRYDPLSRQAPATLPSYIKPAISTQSYRDALMALPGMQNERAAAPATEIADAQSYRDALNALIQKSDAEQAAREQAQAFNWGNFLKSNLMAGWSAIAANAVKHANAVGEPVRDAMVDAMKWAGDKTWLPDMPDETAQIMKSKPALGAVYDWAVDPYNKAAAYADQENKKGGWPAEMGGQVIQSGVQQLPSILAAIASGGGSLVADLGSQVAGGTRAATLERLKALMTSPAFGVSYSQIYGPRYEEARAEGADPYVATLTATISTLMNAAIEAGSGVEDLPFKQNGVREWVQSMLEEGGEEVIQQVIDRLAQKGYVNTAIPWYSTEDENAVINPKVLGENMLVGSVAGGLSSAPVMAMNGITGANRQTENEFPKDVLPKISDTGIQILHDQNMLGLEEAVDRNKRRVWGNYPRFTPEEAAELRKQAEEGGQQPAVQESQTVQETAQTVTEAPAQTESAQGTAEPPAQLASADVSPEIEQMSEEYGEDARTFRAYYEGGDAEQYKRGFDAMFKAGKSGLSLKMLGGVSDQLTAGMSEATKQAIYTAGRNRAANTITPGVQKLTTKKLTSEQRLFVRVWDAIGKEYGLEIDLVDSIKDSNAVYRKGGRRIVVAADAAQGAYVQAAGHEAVHYIRDIDPDAYETLKGVVLGHLTKEDSSFSLEYAVKQRMEQYAEHGRDLTEEDAIEEIVAEAVPTFFADRDAVLTFAKDNPTLAERIRDFFVEFARKIREIAERYMTAENRDEIANLINDTEALKEIARAFDDALRRAQEKPAGKTDGEVVEARKRSKDADDLSKWTPDARFMEEIMTPAERGVFRTVMNDRKNLPAKKMPNGEYVIEAGRALVYTDGKMTKPRIRQIVYFYTNDGTDLDGAMDLWRRGEREGIEYERTRAAIENILGEEGAVVYHNDAFREVQGKDDGRARTNGYGDGKGDRGEVSADRGTKFSLKSTSYPTASEAQEAAEANRAQTQTEEFKAWFEGSVVVNEDGSPKIMYHGTSRSGFNYFRAQEGKYGLMGMGAYFTENPEVAQGYTRKGRGTTPGVYPVYLKITNPIDMDAKAGALAAEWQEFFGEELDGRQLDSDMTNEEILRIVEDALMDAEVPDYEAYDYFRDFYEQHDYDGITHMGGGRWGNGPRHRVYIALSGYQIKSATGNEGGFDGDEIDIRYSLKSEEKKAVREAQDEDWQRIQSGDVTVPDIKVDNETVRRQAAGALNKGLRDKLNQQIGMAANRILRDAESRYGRNELKEKLTELVKRYAANGFDTHTALMAEALANQIIDQSTRKVQSEAAEVYQEARRQLRDAKITLTDTQRQEIENEYGSVNAYRRQVFGTVNVRNEGVTLESLWDELSGKHPEIFPPDTGEAQMPGVIAQFDQLMRPRYENIYGMDAEAAAHDLAMRIQGDVLGMIGAKNAAHDLYGTADKFRKQIRAEYDAEIRARQKARVDEFQQIAGRLKAAKEKGDAETQKKIMAEYRKALKRVDVKTAIAEVRATEKVRYRQQTENRERAQLRDKITKRANSLMNMLVKPEKGKHVPTKLQDSVLKVLEMLDINSERADYHGTETQKSKDYQGSVRWLRYFYDEVWERQSKGETPEELDGLMMTLSERNIMDIRDAIDIFSLDGGVMVLRDMDSSQLKMVDTLLKTVKQSIESIGKLWRIQRYESIIQLGDASIAEMDSRGPQKITNSMVGGARDFFALDNMEPVSYGERLGEAGAEVIQGLMDGEKIKFGKIREASEATEKMLKEIGLRGYDIGKWRKHVRTVNLGGKDVRMTDAMLMSLYLTAKRPQGRQHLLANGMRIPTTDQTGGQVKKILLSEADLSYAAGLLSDKQRQLADRMGEYLSTAVAKWGNDVTQRMYLYDAFTEKNYWPITSDPNVLKTQPPEGERAFDAIVNAGFTKPVNQKATNAVIVMDAFDVFGNHIGEMASYAGYAEVMTDTMAWLNYKQRNSETGLVEGSVKESMESLLGEGGIKYLTNLVQDINGARRGGDIAQLGKIMGNYKKAVVAGKLRVAFQQPTSIVRAAAEINPWYLIKGLRPTKGLPKGKSTWEWLKSNGTVEEMQKWSNLAWWKANGNYDIGIGKGTDAILWGDTSIKDTVMEKIATQGGLVDPGKMDDLTWAHMWLAVKDETRRKRKDLKPGSDEYFRAVAERFEYVMDRTQVVDTVMHRSQMMRGKDGLAKSLTSFMSEPTKSYNMVMRAVMAVGRNPKDRTAQKRLVRTTLAFVASAAATAAATALHDAFRYRDDEEKTLDYLIKGEFAKDWAEQWLRGFMSNANLLDNIPGVSTIIGALQGEEATIMGFETFTDIATAYNKLMNYFRGGNTKKLTAYGAVEPMVKAISEAFGLPFGGIMTNVETLGRIFDPKWAQSKSELTTMDDAYRLMYEATVKGDKKKALEIRTQINKGLYGAAPQNPQKIDTGVAKHLALNDERVLKAWQMREKGNQNDQLVAMHKEMQRAGFTDAQTKYAVNHVQGLFENQYNDLLDEAEELKEKGRKKEAQAVLDEAKALKDRLAKYGMVLEKDAEKDMEAELKVDSYDYEHLFSSIRNGDLDDVEGVAAVMEDESDAKDPAKAIRSQVSSEFREEYIDAVLRGNSAKVRDLDEKLDYFDIDKDDRAQWVKEYRYDQLEDALNARRTSAADDVVAELRESGVSDDYIAGSVSSRFRQTYIDHVVNGEDDEAEGLAEMLRGLGLVTTKGKNKYRQDVLDGWVEDWYKAQEEEEE